MDRIVQYLREKYRPRALLVYGSYVRGDQDGFSDFDCMVIVDSKEKNHDDSVVDGVQLDCYIFTADEVSGEDVDPYITAYDSRIVFDDGIGASLKERVRKYVAEHTVTEESGGLSHDILLTFFFFRRFLKILKTELTQINLGGEKIFCSA